jgi:hypothetical protein
MRCAHAAVDPISGNIASLRVAARHSQYRALCMGCVDAAVEVATQPCGCIALCRACAPKALQCPSCKRPVAANGKTFFPSNGKLFLNT